MNSPTNANHQQLTRLCRLLLLIAAAFNAALGESDTKRLAVSIMEEVPAGETVANIVQMAEIVQQAGFPGAATAYDGFNFQFFNSEKAEKYFNLNPRTGLLTIRQRIDRDNLCQSIDTCCPKRMAGQCYLELNIRSNDEYREIVTLRVAVKDVNDNRPHWLQDELVLEFSESAEVGETRGIPVARDDDAGVYTGGLRYELRPAVQDQFQLEVISGGGGVGGGHLEALEVKDEVRLKLIKKLDREKQSSYHFLLTAFDGGRGRLGGHNQTIPLRILVTDANDHAPVFEMKVYTVDVLENEAIYTRVLQVHAVDVDQGVNSQIEYSFSTLTKPEFRRLFSIDSTTGIIRVQWEIDYEKYKAIQLTVEASDTGAFPRKGSCLVKISVIDRNDHAPEIRFEPPGQAPGHNAFPPRVVEGDPPDLLVAVFTAEDADSGDNGQVVCRLGGPGGGGRKGGRRGGGGGGGGGGGDRGKQYFNLERMMLPFTNM